MVDANNTCNSVSSTNKLKHKTNVSIVDKSVFCHSTADDDDD